jgi:hypothetical protein
LQTGCLNRRQKGFHLFINNENKALKKSFSAKKKSPINDKKSSECASLKISIPIADFTTYRTNRRITNENMIKNMVKRVSLIYIRMSKVFFSRFVMTLKYSYRGNICF